MLYALHFALETNGNNSAESLPGGFQNLLNLPGYQNKLGSFWK